MALVRIGVLGDIHGEDARLEVALGLFERERVEAVLSVGDVIDGLGDDERTVQLLRAAGAPTVRGNHERWFVDGLAVLGGSRRLGTESCRWLSELPRTLPLDTCVGRALLCHGIGDDDMTLLLPEHSDAELGPPIAPIADAGYTLVVAGHTHRRMVRRVGGVALVNAGTLFRRGRAGCVVLDLDAPRARFFDLDEGAATLAETHELPFSGCR